MPDQGCQERVDDKAIKHCEEANDQRALVVNGAAEKHQLEARVSNNLVNGFSDSLRVAYNIYMSSCGATMFEIVLER